MRYSGQSGRAGLRHLQSLAGLPVALALASGAAGAAGTDDIVVKAVRYSAEPAAIGVLGHRADIRNAPALVLIHEWWGLNDNIRDMVRRFAAAGYVALAVDLYGGSSATTREEARRLAGAVRADLPRAFSNLRNAVSYLNGLEGLVGRGRVGSVGWCFGGGWSYQMARNDIGVKASVIYYGRFNPADDLSHMRARIIGHFGEKDRSIRVDSVRAFQARLKTLSGEHEIYIYPNAGHAFANDRGSAYDEKAAERAWERTIAFLKRHL